MSTVTASTKANTMLQHGPKAAAPAAKAPEKPSAYSTNVTIAVGPAGGSASPDVVSVHKPGGVGSAGARAAKQTYEKRGAQDKISVTRSAQTATSPLAFLGRPGTVPGLVLGIVVGCAIAAAAGFFGESDLAATCARLLSGSILGACVGGLLGASIVEYAVVDDSAAIGR